MSDGNTQRWACLIYYWRAYGQFILGLWPSSCDAPRPVAGGNMQGFQCSGYYFQGPKRAPNTENVPD